MPNTPKKVRRPAKVVKLNAMGRPIIEPPAPAPVIPYKITLTIDRTEYTSEGETIEQALANLQTPFKLTVKGSLVLEHESKKTSRDFTPIEMKRFFYPIARFYMAKRLETTLK